MAEGPAEELDLNHLVLKKLSNFEDDAGFPFHDITFSENIMPNSYLQEIEPPLTIHLKTHYEQTDDEHNPPPLAKRIELAEIRKKKKKLENDEDDTFTTPPRKGLPLQTFCPRSLKSEQGWIQCLWPGNFCIIK